MGSAAAGDLFSQAASRLGATSGAGAAADSFSQWSQAAANYRSLINPAAVLQVWKFFEYFLNIKNIFYFNLKIFDF